MLKFLLKLFFTLFIITIIFLISFFYEFFSNSQKIFSIEGKNTSIIRQLGEMVFSPVEKLKGEEGGRINILLLGIGGEKHYGGELNVIHLWTLIALSLGILGENEREYLGDDLKEVNLPKD